VTHCIFWALQSFPEASYFFSVVSTDELLKGDRGDPDESPLILLLWWVVQIFFSYKTFNCTFNWRVHIFFYYLGATSKFWVSDEWHESDPQIGAKIQSSWQPGAWDLFPLAAPPVTWKYHTYSSSLWANLLQPEEVLKLPLCFTGRTWINFTFMGPRVILMYSSVTSKTQRYTIVFITINVLHVSGGSSAHHQELKTVHTASGICQAIII